MLLVAGDVNPELLGRIEHFNHLQSISWDGLAKNQPISCIQTDSVGAGNSQGILQDLASLPRAHWWSQGLWRTQVLVPPYPGADFLYLLLHHSLAPSASALQRAGDK